MPLRSECSRGVHDPAAPSHPHPEELPPSSRWGTLDVTVSCPSTSRISVGGPGARGEEEEPLTHDTAIARIHTPPDAIPGYRLEAPIGRGGMGEVHQAVQLSLGRIVAVKLLRPELAKDEQFVGRFEKEGAALATLRHPNIVSIVDRGKASNTYYLVMEFVDGPSLRERMREPDFDVAKVLVTMLQVTRAIDYAHHRGVIHRDLKPENILFDEQAGGLPKVTDFGLAGFDQQNADTPRNLNLTQTHVAMGTAAYMAPEQAVDAKSVGPRADVYSLGVMLYELLTGELPIGTFAMPSTKKAGIDRRLDAVVTRCLKPSPDDRYPSAAALLADLEQVAPAFTTGLPAMTTKTPLERAVARAREVSRRVWRWTSLSLVLAAVVIVVTVFVRARATHRRVPAAIELTTDFGAKTPLTTPGRVDRGTRVASLGEGPDMVSIRALGRKPRVDHGALIYGQDDGPRAGRAVIDVEVVGSGLEFSVVVDTQPTPPSRLEPLYALFRGDRPDARSALMVLGDSGRFVALVVSGSGGEPTLEWALGPEKNGMMRAPLPTSPRGQRLSLRIDPEVGLLFAIVGEGRDARVLGEGLWMGPDWRQVLGDSPRMAVGCLDGTCAFRQLRVAGLELPEGLSPPPLPSEDMLGVPDDELVSPAQRLDDRGKRPKLGGAKTAKPGWSKQPARPVTGKKPEARPPEKWKKK